MFTLLLYYTTSTMGVITDALNISGKTHLPLEYENVQLGPSFTATADVTTMKVRLPFRSELERCVTGKGPVRTWRLCRHGIQAVQRRTKVRVDCTTQLRSETNISNTASGWEQNLVTVFFNMLLVNGSTSWRFLYNEKHLASMDTFGSLVKFKNQVNETSSFCDDSTDIAEELFQYAAALNGASRRCQDSTVPSKQQSGQPHLYIPRRNRLSLCNTASGNDCRLNWHDHHPAQSEKKMCCVLCRKHGLGNSNRVRSTVYDCRKFTAPLCFLVQAYLRNNCWYVWYITQTMQPRHIATAVPRLGGPSSRKETTAARPHTNNLYIVQMSAHQQEMFARSLFAHFTSASVQDGAP